MTSIKTRTVEGAAPITVADLTNPAETSILERRPRTLKHGDTFAVFDHYGDIPGAPHSSEGMYHEDTRHLSQMALLIDGKRFLLLGSTIQDDNALLNVDLANPDIYRDDTVFLSREMLHVTRVKFLWESCCYERIAVHNFDQKSHSVRFTIRFAADFADLFEVRGAHRAQCGRMRIEHPSDDAVIFRYMGLDNVERTTRIDFSDKPASLTDSEAAFDVMLRSGEKMMLFVTVRCNDTTPTKPREFFSSIRNAQRVLRKAISRAAKVTTSNAVLTRSLSRSVADLSMLVTDTEQGPYPYAGIPWFSTPFGRDGIITALQMLWLDPAVARGVLRFLATTQATREDEESEAEPGKILHEIRRGEMAKLKEVPFGLYYGTIDATPMFLILAGRYFERTGDLKTIEEIWPNIEAALRWIDDYGDADHDGFVEYRARGEKGLTNQGWKDSHDSVSHNDGRLAEGPIALCEVQAYVYAAKREVAKLCVIRGDVMRGAALEKQAAALKDRFESAFWCDDLGTYALALDGYKRKCRVRSSNAGHALFAGIASQARAERLTDTLFSRECFSGWGIRTLAYNEHRYNPMSYHNGSVWPHDNALIALGLSRYGFKTHAAKLFQCMFEAVQTMDLLRLPELFCGFKRRRNRSPTLYPVACAPQAWASVALLTLLEASLGLQFNYPGKEIRFDKPVLPSFVDRVHLQSLVLGNSKVDILLRRHATDVAVNVTSRQGDAKITVVN